MKPFASVSLNLIVRDAQINLVAEKDDYLLDLLVDLGFTDAGQVAKAREEASAAGVGVVDLLVANKVIRPGDVTQAKAAQFGAEVVHLANLKIEDDVIAIVPRDIARKYRVVPVFQTEGKVAVAIADPSDLHWDGASLHHDGAPRIRDILDPRILELWRREPAAHQAALNSLFSKTVA